MISTSATTSTKNEERRRSDRKPHVVQAFLSSPTGGKRLAVTSLDLSKHGIALEVKKPLATGMYQVLELGMGDQKMITEVRILSCREEAGGNFRIHAAFC